MRLYDNSRTVANEHEILAEFKRTSLVSYQNLPILQISNMVSTHGQL